MLYRMLLRVDGEIREWELANKASYDSANVGSSALLAALVRNLRAEVAHWLGEFSLAVFNDFEKFFDSLDLQYLLQETVFTKFPPVIPAYLIQQHVAPRVIQTGSFCSPPVNVWRSILAGCKASVALTRVYLKKSLTLICNKHRNANTNCFVDDTNMHTVGTSYNDTLEVIIPAVSLFGEQAAAMGLKLSPKASIVASHEKLALQAQTELATYGMSFQVEKESRDLGVSHAGGAKRPFKLLSTRYHKRVNKTLKIKSIAQITRKARKLYTGSVFLHQLGAIRHAVFLTP
jgi:hypothetical protein